MLNGAHSSHPSYAPLNSLAEIRFARQFRAFEHERVETPLRRVCRDLKLALLGNFPFATPQPPRLTLALRIPGALGVKSSL
jgi:hypothetical protein